MSNQDEIMLGQIASWLDDFIKDEKDTTYLGFLRLLRDYRSLQVFELEKAIEYQEMKIKEYEVAK